jgi:hypothetical protein
MQFVAQVSLADADPGDAGDAGLLSIFMCQNDPGLCDEWDPVAGGNRAFVFGPDATELHGVPDEGVTLLDEASAVSFEQADGGDYLQAREDWAGKSGRPVREVLGHVGGQPAWLQTDETPMCRTCDEPMLFVVQLEEGHDHRTSANFGGGCGYGFRCRLCNGAAFLWQR